MAYTNGHTNGYTNGQINGHKRVEDPQYIHFPHLEAGTVLEGKTALNRWSHKLTKGMSLLDCYQTGLTINQIMIILVHKYEVNIFGENLSNIYRLCSMQLVSPIER